ncbi:MFS multidrug transporter protein [Rutstroemia sp. NJR-2017a BBW]|nr:MFS multidrug transporter protein [Rutstroemia sp. NJR-2017a BBW]
MAIRPSHEPIAISSARMKPLLYCSSTKPFRPQYLQHEARFNAFTKWADYLAHHHVLASTSIETTTDPSVTISSPNPSNPRTPYVVQFVRKITEHDLITANYQKLNSKAQPTQQVLSRYKNHRCSPDDKFFKANLSHKDLANTHQRRRSLERQADDIDPTFAGKGH